MNKKHRNIFIVLGVSLAAVVFVSLFGLPLGKFTISKMSAEAYLAHQDGRLNDREFWQTGAVYCRGGGEAIEVLYAIAKDPRLGHQALFITAQQIVQARLSGKVTVLGTSADGYSVTYYPGSSKPFVFVAPGLEGKIYAFAFRCP